MLNKTKKVNQKKNKTEEELNQKIKIYNNDNQKGKISLASDYPNHC